MDSRLRGNNEALGTASRSMVSSRKLIIHPTTRPFWIPAFAGMTAVQCCHCQLGAEPDSGVSHLLAGDRAALGCDGAGGVLDEDDLEAFFASIKGGG